MKSLLSRPGRGGEWRGWLRKRAIPRSTTDRLVSRYAETLAGENGNVPKGGAISETGEVDAEKLVMSIWQRFGKLLSTYESVIQFIGHIAELSGVGHEERAEGFLIFEPAPTAAEELLATAPALDSAPQPSDKVSVITEEPTPAPLPFGQSAAAANACNGGAA